METPPRKWSVLVAVSAQAQVEVSVWADDVLLLPELLCEPPSEVIHRVMLTLSDFRQGDSISTVVRAAGLPLVSWSGRNVHLALHWLASALMDAWWQLIHSGTKGSLETEPASGVRATAHRQPDAPVSDERAEGPDENLPSTLAAGK